MKSNKWRKVKLGEISKVTKLSGFEFTKHFEYVEHGEIIALRALNVKNGTLNLNDIKKIERNVSNNLLRSKLFKNEIILTYTGANLGEVALIDEDDRYHLAPNVSKVTVEEYYNPIFYFYYLRSKEFKQNLLNYSVGSSQPTIPMGIIREIPVPIPPIEIQNKIAHILSSIDNKIENNNMIIDNLQKQSQELYKRWFIDFDFPDDDGRPYKTNGGKLDKKSNMPLGWYESNFSQLEIKYGKLLPKSKLTEYGYFVYGSSKIMGFYSEFSNEEREIIIGCRGTVGRTTLTKRKSFITNNSLIIRPNNFITKYYLLYFCKSNNFIDVTSGSAQPQITITNLENKKIIVPDKTLQKKFSKFIGSYILTIDNCENENNNLTEIKNSLLPKLMNGDIEIT